MSIKPETSKRRNTQSGHRRDWNDTNEHTVDDDSGPQQPLPLSAAPQSPTLPAEKHKHFICKS